MFCKNCGTALNDNASVCANCGTKVEAACAPAPQKAPVQTAPVVTNIVPARNRPLSPWAYLGLQFLFAIPIVGFIFLIVFSFNGSNVNRRNFARSYWCALLLVVIAVAVLFLIGIFSGILVQYA